MPRRWLIPLPLILLLLIGVYAITLGFWYPTISGKFAEQFWIWFMFLMSTIGIVCLSPIAQSAIRSEPRQHNGVKLLNECLAHSQLAFLPYYFGFLSAVELPTWFRNTGTFLIIWSLIVFLVGVFYFVKNQELTINASGHKCPLIDGKPDPSCKLAWDVAKRFVRVNLITAILSFLAAVISAGIVASETKAK